MPEDLSLAGNGEECNMDEVHGSVEDGDAATGCGVAVVETVDARETI